jgi:hypothetical protein
MLDQFTTVADELCAADRNAQRMGSGACNRCVSENCPHPCYGFVGPGYEPSQTTTCQRDWCGHSFGDHA